MTDKVIEYKSAQKTITYTTNVLETVDKEGIVCSWTGNTTDGLFNLVNFTWDFDWTKLKNKGFDSLTGHLIVKPSPSYSDSFPMLKVDIDWNGGNETIAKHLIRPYDQVYALFEYHLTAHYAEIPEIEKYDEMFAASEMNDAVLVVEGRKLHVNKVFLSIHSEFFRALFSSNFKEGQLTEIPIEDVSYQDFALLLSAIYPKQVFPNDGTTEKLLELADRFLMPSVTHLVEHHLLEHSKIENEKLMFMADAYGMPTLLEKCIQSMDTVKKVKAVEKSEEFNKMSLQTSHKLFKRLLQIV